MLKQFYRYLVILFLCHSFVGAAQASSSVRSCRHVFSNRSTFEIKSVGRTDVITEGSQRLYQWDHKSGSYAEFSVFGKDPLTGQFPKVDIERSTSPDGIEILYLRKNNAEHALLIKKAGEAIVLPIVIQLGSPSRVKTNLGNIEWSSEGSLKYTARESIRRVHRSKILDVKNLSMKQLAEALKQAIEFNSLPNLALLGVYYRPGIAQSISNIPRVLLEYDHIIELESIVHEYNHLSGAQRLIQNAKYSSLPVAVVKFEGQTPNGYQYFQDVSQARMAYENGANVVTSIIEFQSAN